MRTESAAAGATAFFAAEEAVKNKVPILIDLDFRADQWHDPRSFGVTTRAYLRSCTIALGTEEEILATMLSDPNQIKITNKNSETGWQRFCVLNVLVQGTAGHGSQSVRVSHVDLKQRD